MTVGVIVVMAVAVVVVVVVVVAVCVVIVGRRAAVGIRMQHRPDPWHSQPSWSRSRTRTTSIWSAERTSMRNRDLTTPVDARKKSKKGRRPSVSVREECRFWAARHQDILRRALADPNGDTDLTASYAPSELDALGAFTIRVGGCDVWTCAAGDDELNLRILGLSDCPDGSSLEAAIRTNTLKVRTA